MSKNYTYLIKWMRLRLIEILIKLLLWWQSNWRKEIALQHVVKTFPGFRMCVYVIFYLWICRSNGIKWKWTFHQLELSPRTCQCYDHQLRNVNPIEMHTDDISVWYEFDKSHKGQEGMSKFIAWSLLHRAAEIVSYWLGVRQIIREIQSLYDRDSLFYNRLLWKRWWATWSF